MADPDDTGDIEFLKAQNDVFVSQILELKRRVEHLESIVLNLPEARLQSLEDRVEDLEDKSDTEESAGGSDADEPDTDLNRAVFRSILGNLHY